MNLKHKPAISIKSRVAVLMLLCWFLPLAILAGMNLYYLSGSHLETQIFNEVDRLKFNNKAASDQLEIVAEASLRPSYDGDLLDAHTLYKEGTISGDDLVAISKAYLRQNYDREETLDLALMWYWDNPYSLHCSAYDTGAGLTYSDVLTYWQKDHEKVQAMAKQLGTKADFFLNDGRLYWVRNICTSEYQPAATLVLRVNREVCFDAYTTFSEGTDVTLLLNDCTLQLSGDPVSLEESGKPELGGHCGYTLRSGTLHLYHERVARNCSLTALVRIDNNPAFSPFWGYSKLFFMTLLLIVPLMALLMVVFHRHVSKPIQDLMDGADEIENGHLGYQVDEEPESTEFRYLVDSFNAMSSKLEYQFRHIYEEELALRDARIKALQSQINPHFMNNTLEIINWEARLSGNDKVSRMIEALSTLMNAGMDRKMLPEIPLSEEMIYVEAYLYIISQRMGDRLTILNELPEDIMNCKVPRLILQPVIENAVEHGAVRNGRGTVLLYGYREGEYLYLEIMNDSVMTPEDAANVKRLLSSDCITGRESSYNLGIANVNQRLKILYGADSGLSVEQVDAAHVRARLTIHLKPEND